MPLNIKFKMLVWLEKSRLWLQRAIPTLFLKVSRGTLISVGVVLTKIYR